MWLSAYELDPFPDEPSDLDASLVVLEGIEYWVEQAIKTVEDPVGEWITLINKWTLWEEAYDMNFVLIGTDITKGIVPVRSLERKWRDTTGRCYQLTSRKAHRVDLIWYGIHQTIKRED
jgi:adenosyl cobinamide kinase/adenosyl cobinamide phosphate guanylyltransferase